MALLELIEDIILAVDNKKRAIGVFADLKRAFDTIDHTLLLKKLEHYCIRGVAYDWIKSYLCERKQYVSANSCNYDAMNVVGPMWCAARVYFRANTCYTVCI